MHLRQRFKTTLAFAGRLLWHVFLAIGSPRGFFNQAFNSKESFHDSDGRKHYTWRAVRRQNINALTWDICKITYFITFAHLLQPGQHEMSIYHTATKQTGDYELNYGISYNLCTLFLWMFALVFLFVDALFTYYPRSLVSLLTSLDYHNKHFLPLLDVLGLCKFGFVTRVTDSGSLSPDDFHLHFVPRLGEL